MSVVDKAKQFGIDMNHCPLALYTSTLHGDLSQHLGTLSVRQAGKGLTGLSLPPRTAWSLKRRSNSG